MKRILQTIIYLAVLLAVSAAASNPISTGYGADGPYEVYRDSIKSTSMNGAYVHLFRPARSDTAWPVIFFVHGIGGHNPVNYLELLIHVASKGHAVIYAPYPATVAMARPKAAYATMRSGFEQGVREWRSVLDSSRTGFVGHSYGGGAVPAMAQYWLVNKSWGCSGSFLYIMAPWYSYDISPQQLESFPDSSALIIQVFEDDQINDHRMAKDIFDNIGISSQRKNFIILHSDSCSGTTLHADHSVPSGIAGGGSLDNLDYYGIWRLIDALSDYALSHNSNARETALGSGLAVQRFMGKWPDGTIVKELTATHTGLILFPQNSYLNFWSHRSNPRFNRKTVFNSLPFLRNNSRMTIRNYMTLKPGAHHDNGSIVVPHSSENLAFAPIDSGFGSIGPYKVRKRDFPHPLLGHGKVYIFSPEGITGPAPVIIFLHDFIYPMPDFYQGLITNLASQGYHVIFPSYMLYRRTPSNRKRYDLMIQGAEEAFLMLGDAADTTKIGFIGHSYGGGAVPAVAWHYLKLKEWGRNGAFMYIIAPWYVHNFTPNQFEYFPSHTRLVLQVFESERFNDWRMAEDLFYSFNTIAPEEKDFVIVHNDHYQGKLLSAEHVSPLSGNASQIDAIDYFALYRTADALAAEAFTNDSIARNIALGNGHSQQKYMGVWPDGTPVTELSITDHPVTPYHQKSYFFNWNRPWNKRRHQYQPVEKAKPKWLYRLTKG